MIIKPKHGTTRDFEMMKPTSSIIEHEQRQDNLLKLYVYEMF